MYDSWGAVFSGDHKIGFTHQLTERRWNGAGAPAIVSRWRTRLAFTRAGVLLEFEEKAVTEEDAAGHVRRYHYEVSSYSGGERRTHASVSGVAVGDTMVVDSGGYEQRAPLAPDAVGPYRFHELLLRKRASHAPEFDIAAFLPELGRAVGVHVTFGPVESVVLRSGRVRLQRVVQTMAPMPNRPETLWMDDSGEIRLTETHAPLLGRIRIEQTDRETAMAPASPVELMAAAVIHSPAAIPAPRRLRHAEYVLSFPKEAAAQWPQGQGQTVQPLGAGEVRVTVDVSRAESPGVSPGMGDADSAEPAAYLRPTAFLQSDAPLIRRMAAEAVGDLRNPVEMAHAIERYVRVEIHDKSLDMGFASALETARAKRGDCSEHAVLCAALARACGIPSRIVVGIAYVSGPIFGIWDARGLFVFHVWTELMVKPGAWLPIDAALGGFDATHIALTKNGLDTVSPLADLCLPVLEIVDRLRVRAVKPAAPTPPE